MGTDTGIQMSESFKATRRNMNPPVNGNKKPAYTDGGPTGMHGKQVVCVYFPKNPNEPSISINGIVVPKDGYKSFGFNPVLHKWLGTKLRVSLLTPEQAGVVPAKPFRNVPAKPQPAPKAVEILTEANPVVEPFLAEDGIGCFADAPALKGIFNKKEDVVEEKDDMFKDIIAKETEVDLGDIDDISIPTQNEITEQYPEFKDFKVFANKLGVTGRGYKEVMDKLIAEGKVKAQAC